MSEVKDVRAALNRLATRNGGSEAQLLAALKDMKPGAPGISFEVGPPLSKIEAALVSEGLAACDEYDRLEHQVTRGEYGKVSWEEGISKGPWQGVRVSVFASILRKAGLLK